MRVLVGTAVLTLLLAGCVTQPVSTASTTTLTSAAASAVTAHLATLMSGIACQASSVSNTATSSNLKLLANITYDKGMHGELDARGDYLLSARYSLGGFDVSNIADPANPVLLGKFQSKEQTAYDVKWMPDNLTAIVGHQKTVDLVDVSPLMQPGLTPAIIEERNITPRLISTWTDTIAAPQGGGETNMHMMTAVRIAGTDWVFIAPNDNNGVILLKLTGTGDGRKLEYVSNIGTDVPGGPIGPHDMSVVWDGILHKPILYIANGFEGWRAYDVSDPAKAVMLATMPNFGAAQAYTHTVIGQKVGDRRLVATIQEVGVNTLTIWDATDFSKPVPIAQWRADATNPTTPEHNIQILDGRLYMAHYTYGMFVFDLTKVGTTPIVTQIQPIAHFAPPVPATGSGSLGPLGFSNVWDVVVNHGIVYVNDIESGTYSVGFGCLQPMAENETSTN
ncbi:MAG: LVIVD repeat-containing protein [Thermoplasmatota archaeon]